MQKTNVRVYQFATILLSVWQTKNSKTSLKLKRSLRPCVRQVVSSSANSTLESCNWLPSPAAPCVDYWRLGGSWQMGLSTIASTHPPKLVAQWVGKRTEN